MTIKSVILSGGSGTRLWPASRESYPKQLLPLTGDHSLLQETAARLKGFAAVDVDPRPLVVTNEEYRFIIAEQLRQIGVRSPQIVLEPVGRNTAPALTLAALAAAEEGDPILLVMPADHVITDLAAFQRAIAVGAKAAAEGALVESARAKAFATPRNDLKLGCNFARYTSDASRYAKFFAQAFDFATIPFYPRTTVPEKDCYDYSYVDHALSFLLDKGITPKGHPLWFGHQDVNPKWLFGLPYPELRREAANIARHHVSTYRDTIQYWDAMNEAHDWANCFELTQEQLIDLTRATTDALREGNDKAVSIVNVCLPFAEYVAGRYNCYGALPEHLRSPLSYFKTIIEAGIDFDVVGIQLYFPGRDLVAVDLLLNAFAALGKPIHITEMGVNGGFRQKGNAGSSWSQMAMSEGTWHGGWNEHTQADWLEQFYTIAASRKEIQALTWWDFIEPSFSGNGAMLYENENPRESYFRLMALKNRIVRKA